MDRGDAPRVPFRPGRRGEGLLFLGAFRHAVQLDAEFGDRTMVNRLESVPSVERNVGPVEGFQIAREPLFGDPRQHGPQQRSRVSPVPSSGIDAEKVELPMGLLDQFPLIPADARIDPRHAEEMPDSDAKGERNQPRAQGPWNGHARFPRRQPQRRALHRGGRCVRLAVFHGVPRGEPEIVPQDRAPLSGIDAGGIVQRIVHERPNEHVGGVPDPAVAHPRQGVHSFGAFFGVDPSEQWKDAGFVRSPIVPFGNAWGQSARLETDAPKIWQP